VKATTAILIQCIDGQLIVGMEVKIENLEVAMEARGYTVRGLCGKPCREEMHGQPMFTKVIGPMYGGPGIVRYEDEAAYEKLSK
jgi:hypothetical protein